MPDKQIGTVSEDALRATDFIIVIDHSGSMVGRRARVGPDPKNGTGR